MWFTLPSLPDQTLVFASTFARILCSIIGKFSKFSLVLQNGIIKYDSLDLSWSHKDGDDSACRNRYM